MENILDKKMVLGVGITSATKENILEYLFKNLRNTKDQYFIVTPNPEIVVFAQKDREFRDILNQARFSLPDGIGIIWASKVLGKSIPERITGTDFMDEVCKESAKLNKSDGKKPITVGFLGAWQNVAELTAECLSKKYPGLEVAFTGPEWDQKKVASSIDILFVAYGFPKQEQWMAKHIGRLPVRVMMGVGGAFDYISGNVSRAPKLFRSLGLEWLYRLIRQPWRLKRQRALLSFVSLVLSKRKKI